MGQIQFRLVYGLVTYLLVPAAEIRDYETGLVSEPFSWFQSRQIFRETHETEANPIYSLIPPFLFLRTAHIGFFH